MKIEVARLTVREPFKSLFPVEQEVVDALTADMKANGFDAARSIIAWKSPCGLIVVDGHMRLLAAKAARLKEVHVTLRKFADEDEAFAFAIASQRDRRNLTKLEIAEAIARAETARAGDFATVADSPRQVGSKPGTQSGGSTKDPVKAAVVEKAVKAGVSTRTAERALANVRAENGAAPKPKGRPPKHYGEGAEDAAAELRISLRLDRSDALALLRAVKRLRKNYGDEVTKAALPIAHRLVRLAGDRDPIAFYEKEAAPVSDEEAQQALIEIGASLATALTPTTRRRKSK